MAWRASITAVVVRILVMLTIPEKKNKRLDAESLTFICPWVLCRVPYRGRRWSLQLISVGRRAGRIRASIACQERPRPLSSQESSLAMAR